MEGKPIPLWGAPPSADASQGFAAACSNSGGNLGNLLIGHAVHSVLRPYPLMALGQCTAPEQADEVGSAVVIAAANFLWKDFDLGNLASFLERTHLPIVMIGVGAQASDRSDIAPIHPGTLRLMKVVSERSASIGVRGYYSAEVLAANGIHNIEVIGCPSLYASGKPSVSVESTRCQRKPGAAAVSFSRRVCQHSFSPRRLKAIENVVMSYAMGTSATFIAQDELAEASTAVGTGAVPRAVATYFDSHSRSDVTRFFRDRTRWFGTVEQWAGFVATLDVVVGSRLHGALMALTNATPALLIAHDSRTLELAALAGIPRLHVMSDAARDLSVEKLSGMIRDLSFSEFDKSYRALYSRYVAFLTANRLPHRLSH